MFLNCEYLLQFCKNFRVGERCCEFECLDPPGEDTRYRERQRLRALILAGNSSAVTHGPSLELKAGISLLAVAVARLNVWDDHEVLDLRTDCANWKFVEKVIGVFFDWLKMKGGIFYVISCCCCTFSVWLHRHFEDKNYSVLLYRPSLNKVF